jgi:hypothetical protein
MTVVNPGGSGATTPVVGTLAARPAAGTAGRIYFTTDTKELFMDSGAAWLSIATTTSGFGPAAGFNLSVPNGGLLDLSSQTSNNSIYKPGGIVGVNCTAVDLTTVGGGLRVAEGLNAKQGITGAMSAGSVTVANTSVTANSRILVCRMAGGTNPGAWYVSAQTAGTSFVATSTNAADTGNGVFFILEPG